MLRGLVAAPADISVPILSLCVRHQCAHSLSLRPTMRVAGPTCLSSLAPVPRGLDAAAMILSTCFWSQRGMGPTQSIGANHFWPLVRHASPHVAPPCLLLEISFYFASPVVVTKVKWRSTARTSTLSIHLRHDSI
jgi:hypothetical protein